MTVSLRLNDADYDIIRKYAQIHGISVSDLFRQAVLERIEDEFDLTAYNKAMEEYRAGSVTYSLNEVEKELGLS